MRRFLKEYFTLSKSERNGLIVLLIILVLVIFVPQIYMWLFPREPLKVEITSFGERNEVKEFKKNDSSTWNLHPFNPNKISQSEMMELGLDSNLVTNLIKYRNAGGKFYEKDDLLRLYGMDKETYLKLEPYIELGNKWNSNYNNRDQYSERYKPFEGKVDINKADAQELQKLSGIGPVYSERIVEYRDEIGGFDSIGQLLEVYGIDDTLLSEINPQLEISEVKKPTDQEELEAEKPMVKIDLNKADSLQLIEVRGVGPYFAHRILEYRENLGGYHSFYQLYEIYNLDSAAIGKIQRRFELQSEGIRKINLNKADQETLQNHPYINRAVANFIISYRIDHLKIKNLEELKSSYLVDEELLSKIAPYIEL